MRLSWLLTLLALAGALGCGDSRSVRIQTPLATGSVQDQLDSGVRVVAARLLGANP